MGQRLSGQIFKGAMYFELIPCTVHRLLIQSVTHTVGSMDWLALFALLI